MKKVLYITFGIFILYLTGSYFVNKQPFSLYSLDVGQGSSTLIKTNDGENILIDGGPDAKTVSELGKILPYFDRIIDLLIITHSHDDHVGGLIDVFERYDVKTVVYTGVVDDTQIYKQLLEMINKERSKVVIARAGQEYNFLDKQIKSTILYPINSIENKIIENPNNGSVVILFSLDKNKIMITGDLEEKGEAELVDYWSDKLTIKNEDNVIYVAGHHGSNTSSSKKFLDYIKPDISIISVGKKNKFNHPSLIITERLKARSKIWRTDELGTIKAYIKNKDWQVKAFRIGFINLF